MPLATTEKVAVAGATTAWFSGWVAMAGGRFTVRAALPLVSLP